MHYEDKKKWELFYYRIFDDFAQNFRYGITLAAVVIIQFITVEILIYTAISRLPAIGFFTYSIAHCCIVFSSAFYGCSHVACRSYMYRKKRNTDGMSKYRTRATENFIAGLIFFLIAIIVLVFLLYLDKTS
jgi:hypothetical protein